jgi:hypothetical protein
LQNNGVEVSDMAPLREWPWRIRRALRNVAAEVELPFLAAGSERWLIAKERHYGGFVTAVTIGRVSPYDPRPPHVIRSRSMIGGDRMAPKAHGYAPYYSRHLAEFVGKNNITCIEVGILRGTGLAIWSDLFPAGRIFGLDIDLSHFHSNETRLRRAGAFKTNNVSVHEFDQFSCSPDSFADLLNGGTIDVMIDDGFHSDDAVFSTFAAALPHLSARYVYFIEDNNTLALERLVALAPAASIQRYGLLTVIDGGQTHVT